MIETRGGKREQESQPTPAGPDPPRRIPEEAHEDEQGEVHEQDDGGGPASQREEGLRVEKAGEAEAEVGEGYWGEAE